VVMFIFVGVEGRAWIDYVCKGVFYGFYFRVFRLYTTPLVCII